MNLTDEEKLSHGLRRLVADEPFELDIETIGRRVVKRRQRALALRGAASAAAAVVIAGGLFTALHGNGAAASGTTAGSRTATGDQVPGANPTLMSLAARVTADSASLPGDASLVFQHQVIGGVQQAPVYYLYADDGDLYGGNSKSELQVAVAKHELSADDGIAPELAAARYAATGNLATAQVKVVNATGGTDLGLGLPPAARQKLWSAGTARMQKMAKMKSVGLHISPVPPTGKALQQTVANLVWTGTTEALTSGGGDPAVKAGVLRLLATVPGVTITKSATGGQVMLTLTAGPAVFGGTAHHEVLVVNGSTGAPTSLASVDTGKDGMSATETYQVSRASLAAIAQGKF